MTRKLKHNVIVALLMFWGATFMFGCDSIPELAIDKATTPMMVIDSFTMINTEDGNLAYKVNADQMKRFEAPDSSFLMLEKGVYVESFSDSTMVVTSTLKGDRAYYSENKKIWKINGNVIGVNVEDGKTLTTEELFWDEKTRKIYSFVYSRYDDGEQVMIGENGFYANEDLSHIKFNGSLGSMIFDTTATVESDDTMKVDTSLIVKPEL